MQGYSTLFEVKTHPRLQEYGCIFATRNFCFKVYIDLITGRRQHKENYNEAKAVSTENILTISDELELFHTLRYNRGH